MKNNNSSPIYSGQFQCMLKGDRGYIHGTDLFDLLFKDLQKEFIDKKISNITISFIKMVNYENIFFDLYEGTYKDDKSSVRANFNIGDKKFCALLKEYPPLPVNRYPFDEDEITLSSILLLEKRKILLKDKVNFSFIEILVAMNKKLLNSLFPPEKQWLLVKATLSDYNKMNDYDCIELIASNTRHLKLVVTDIYVNNQKFGKIYFSLVE